jgi:hypothetical protein
MKSVIGLVTAMVKVMEKAKLKRQFECRRPTGGFVDENVRLREIMGTKSRGMNE